MAINLTRPKHRSLTNPSLIHLFSTTNNTPNEPSPQNPTNQTESQQSHSQSSSQTSSSSSFFSDVKASLKKKQQQQQNNPNLAPLRKPTYPSSGSSSGVASLEEIAKNLSEFRRRSAVPNPTENNPSSQPISFQELYKRNVIAKSNAESGPVKSGGVGKPSYEAIRDSLRQMRGSRPGNVGNRSKDAMSLENFKNSLRLQPENAGSNVGSTVIGGTDELPRSVFGKEMNGEGGKKTEAMRTEFVRMYSFKDLGAKLRKLRPEGVKEGEVWFSLEELNERLGKLREIEEKESQSSIVGVSFKDLRDSLMTMKLSDDEKARKTYSESGKSCLCICF